MESNNAPLIHHFGEPVQLPDNLDEHILYHQRSENFVDSPVFVALFLAVVFVIGCAIGVLLAL